MRAPANRLKAALWRLPLRTKVAIWTGLLASVVQLLIAAGVVVHLQWEGLEELDKSLARASRRFFREIHERVDTINWNNAENVERMLDADGEIFFKVAKVGGEVLHRSEVLDRASMSGVVQHAKPVVIRSRGKPLRIVAYEQEGIQLTLGVNAHMVYEMREDILRTFLVTCPLAFLVASFGGWWIAGRALAPVGEVTEAAEAITAESLGRRLPKPPANDEIGRLTAVLNRMIDRLETSFHQARRFSADASHELRTPLTILRGELEAALREPGLALDQERLLANLLEEVNRLSRITEGLLLLSRADSGRLQIEKSEVHFSPLVADLVEDFEILAESHQVRIEHRVAENVIVHGQEQFLRQLVTNLLDNALKYNRSNGLLRVGLNVVGNSAVLTVGNSGPGIDPRQSGQVFERFFRGTAAQDSAQGGNGLGLSICREIARAHDGEIVLSRAEPDWTEFRLALPVVVNTVKMTSV